MSAANASVNYWPHTSCAKAFWSQRDTPAYQRLLKDTAAWLDPKAGDEWLDLGCGSGPLTEVLWRQSGGRIGQIVCADCATVNMHAIDRLRQRLEPRPQIGQIQFVALDFSSGLPAWKDSRFDGVVSGLSIQYAQSYSLDRQDWTTEAYDRLLFEVFRVLRPGGCFVFSVNVPEPSWGRVALRSIKGVFRAPRPARYVKNAWRMLRYGRWLKQEARRGRFHYLPENAIRHKLAAAAFMNIEHRLSYAGQAYLFRCRKP